MLAGCPDLLICPDLLVHFVYPTVVLAGCPDLLVHFVYPAVVLAGCPDLLVHFVYPAVVLAGCPDLLVHFVYPTVVLVGCPDYWFQCVWPATASSCQLVVVTAGFVLCVQQHLLVVLTACFVLSSNSIFMSSGYPDRLFHFVCPDKGRPPSGPAGSQVSGTDSGRSSDCTVPLTPGTTRRRGQEMRLYTPDM